MIGYEMFWVALAAGIAAVGGTLTARLVDLFAARRGQVGPYQDELVSTLRETSNARADRIRVLEEDLGRERAARDGLEKRVARLEAINARLLELFAAEKLAIPFDLTGEGMP